MSAAVVGGTEDAEAGALPGPVEIAGLAPTAAAKGDAGAEGASAGRNGDGTAAKLAAGATSAVTALGAGGTGGPRRSVSAEVVVDRWLRGATTHTTDQVAEEIPVALVYHNVPHVVMLATPADLEDFAVGF